MKIFIEIKYKNKVHRFELHTNDCVSIGCGENDDFLVKETGIKKEHLSFYYNEDGEIFALCKGHGFLSGQKFKKGTVPNNSPIQIVKKGMLLFSAKVTDQENQLSVPITHGMLIGKKPECSIMINNRMVSGNHAQFRFGDDECKIIDMDSTNGTFINGTKISSHVLSNGDVINVLDYKFTYSNERLYFYADDAIKYHYVESAKKKKGFPIIQISPKFMSSYPKGDMRIQNPPNVGSKPSMNWFSLLTYPASSLLSGLVTSHFFGDGYQWWYSVPMAVTTMAMPILNHINSILKHKKNAKLRVDKYSKYIRGVEDQLADAAKAQLDVKTESHPKTQSCLPIVEQTEKELWNRKPDDEDFLCGRVGTGKALQELRVVVQDQSLALVEDELLTSAKTLTEKYKYINGMPITVDLKKSPVMGIVGERKSGEELLRNILVQLTTFHSYEDLCIAVLFPKAERNRWEWTKWLPHVFNDDRTKRLVACTYDDSNEVLKEIDSIIATREIDTNSSKKPKLPFYLLVVADPQLSSNMLLQKALSVCSAELGIAAIVLADEAQELPDSTQAIAFVKDSNGIIKHKDGSTDIVFKADDFSVEQAERFSRAMAPLRLAVTRSASTLPSSVTFFEGYGAHRPYDFDIAKKWSESCNYKSMAVPIGIRANGDLFMFDIYEKAHGPYGLIAGMTGSGKTEMIQSWILSMALHFSPQDVNFVLIDFKGTGLILPFMKLPHLAGTISDQDKNIAKNFIALQSELDRRKNLFTAVGVRNIRDYLIKCEKEYGLEKIPFLFIVFDEFAEFKKQYPEFTESINTFFSQGRSHGIYLILLTQNPSGIVTEQMETNTQFRWCLKVAAPSNSTEMLGSGHTEAARITNPGRAYIKVGEYKIFEQIQSLWSGAPYSPVKRDTAASSPQISVVKLNGERECLNVADKTVGKKSFLSESDVIVNYIDSFVMENNIQRAKPVWQPELPDKLALQPLLTSAFNGSVWPSDSKSLSAVIGMADDFKRQSQYPLSVNLASGHLTIFGAPMSGKTTLLQTLIMSLCFSYSPDEVNVYIMDFNSWTLGVFKDYPHIGGIANHNEKEKIEKLTVLIDEILSERRKLFSNAGVGNILDYREFTGKKLPFIVLAVDDFSGVMSQYPDLTDFFTALSGDGANYGVMLVLTANAESGIHYNMRGKITNRIALRMTDSSDYASALLSSLSELGGIKPAEIQGRGLFKLNINEKDSFIVEFQTALPVEAADKKEEYMEIKRTGKVMRSCWSGELPPPIPVMPEVIEYGSVRSSGITLGLSSHDIKPVAVDFEASHYMLISGTDGSGKTNMLRVIANQFKHNFSSLVAVVDLKHSWSAASERYDRYITDTEEADELFTWLAGELQQRKNALEEETSSSFDRLLIVVDDFGTFLDDISNETWKKVNALIKMGKSLNVFFVAAGDYTQLIKRNIADNIVITMVGGKNKLLLGGSANTHSCFDTNLNYSQKSEELAEYEGYLLDGKKAIKIKTMKE